MRLIKTLFMAALLSCLASYAHACAVDGVASKTDTTITISWNVSGCNKLSAGETFEVCWKDKGAWNFPCGANRIGGIGESGTTTISGLSPGQTYKIRTKWHHRSWGWKLVTNRTVTTDPTSQSSSNILLLRYVKKSTGPSYSVDFYFKHTQTPPPTLVLSELSLHFHHKNVGTAGIWVSSADTPLITAVPYAPTQEFTINVPGFINSTGYRAQIFKGNDAISNRMEWK
jgi:hypothetical protein